jgi:hypothetical protein
VDYIVGVKISVPDKDGNKVPITTSYHAVDAQNADEAKRLAIKWFADGYVDTVAFNMSGDVEYVDKFRCITYESTKATMASPADVFNFFAVTSGLSDAGIIGRAKEKKLA